MKVLGKNRNFFSTSYRVGNEIMSKNKKSGMNVHGTTDRSGTAGRRVFKGPNPFVWLNRGSVISARKGPSQSTHARTRKMVIYACVGARSEETLMEALV